jgi:hypothetical protein
MKKLTILALSLSALAFNASAKTEIKQTQTTLVSTTAFESSATSSTDISNTPATVTTVGTENKVNKERKSWEDRTLGGKILIGTGVGIFVVLALLFGTVSVG